jgi:hypothetical protein
MIGAILAAFAVFFRSRLDVSLEVLALRQQVAVAETSATAAESPRSTLLDHAAQCVAAMVGCSGDRETCDRNRMASKRLPTILALAIQAAGRPTWDYRRGSKSHSQDET